MRKTTRLTACVAAALLASAAAGFVQAENIRPTHTTLSEQGAAAVTPRNIVLFFDEDSAALTDDAVVIVHDAVKAAERAGSFRIALTAYSARDELKRDPQLATRRAAAVRRVIEDFGFDGDVVAGGQDPRLVSANRVDDTLNRRVVIHLEG